jgi:epoxyqueuosine reductase QueG
MVKCLYGVQKNYTQPTNLPTQASTINKPKTTHFLAQQTFNSQHEMTKISQSSIKEDLMKTLLIILSLMFAMVACNKSANEAKTEYKHERQEAEKDYRDDMKDVQKESQEAIDDRNEEIQDARKDLHEKVND